MVKKNLSMMERLVRGSLGEIKADLILRGGRLINVYSGEVLEGVDIAVLDGRICYVGPSAAHTRGEETKLLDAEGRWIAPGFIDGHTHVGHFCRPFELFQAYVPHGTTALVASCDEHSAVFGLSGMEQFLAEAAAHPLRAYALVSMAAPQDPKVCHTQSLSSLEAARMLRDPRVLGLGEIVSWLRLVRGDREVLERIGWTLENGKMIHGHTAGARDRRLCAIAAASVSSCHEPINERDALERLRLGYWTMLREGSFRRDMEATLKPLVRRGVDTQRLILVTDAMGPDDVAVLGHMDFVLRRAIECGLSPVRAIQAVTLNPATYSGLEQDLGGLAPGRYADFVILDELDTVRVHTTWIGGQLVASEGQSKVASEPPPVPPHMYGALPFKSAITADHLRVRCEKGYARIRVMELMNQTITRESLLDVASPGGTLPADPERDLLKVAVFDRHSGSGWAAFGFLKGFGFKGGAVGSTVNLDEYSLMVVGSSDYDMAYCANLLIESGGGIAIVDRSQVLEHIAYPVGGLFGLDAWQDAGAKLKRAQDRLRQYGVPFDKPLTPLCFLTFVTLPALRITDRGLVRVKDREIVPLLVEEGEGRREKGGGNPPPS